ncbi:MAG: phage tail protein [Oscillospiraceae bacterium]|nr:phage tail protein [Oscillospiraceae bacterium]
MAYKAYLNGTLFFNTDTELDSLILTSAAVKLKAGSAGDFTFVIPPQNAAYGNFHRLVDYVDVYDDSRMIFSGRVYSVEVVFDTQQKVECEGLLAVLNDSIYRPATYTGYLHGLIEDILTKHNAQVSSDKQLQVGQLMITNYHIEEKEYKNYESSLSRIKDLVDTYGGSVYVRKVSNTLYFDWLEEFEGYTNQKIMLGENLMDLSKKQDSSDIVTALIPTGALQDDGSKLTISSVNGGLDYITAEQSLVNEFGMIYGNKEWTDITTPEDLKTRATKWLDINSQPKYSVKIKAIDLANAGYNVTNFTVGQYIQVISVPHGLIDTITDESSTVDLGIVDKAVVDIGGVAYWFEVNELNLNLLDVSQNYLQLGKDVAGYVGSLARTTSTIVNQMEALSQAYATKSLMEQEVIRATDLITGNMGGYVVIHDADNDGYPDEILIMDSPDINSAVNVWRWNKNGLGFSSTGYVGSYGTAVTADGKIVADFITAGTLSGDRVRAGKIESVNGNTYWDLDAGDLNFNNTFTVDSNGNVVANALTANDATLTGEVKSATGIIGGWNLHDGYMDYTMSGTHIYLYGGTYVDGSSVIGLFEQQSNAYWTTPTYTPIMAFSTNARLTLDGDLIVRDIYLEGKIHTEADSNVAGLSYIVVSTF